MKHIFILDSDEPNAIEPKKVLALPGVIGWINGDERTAQSIIDDLKEFLVLMERHEERES